MTFRSAMWLLIFLTPYFSRVEDDGSVPIWIDDARLALRVFGSGKAGGRESSDCDGYQLLRA